VRAAALAAFGEGLPLVRMVEPRSSRRLISWNTMLTAEQVAHRFRTSTAGRTWVWSFLANQLTAWPPGACCTGTVSNTSGHFGLDLQYPKPLPVSASGNSVSGADVGGAGAAVFTTGLLIFQPCAEIN
jgi:hypothetical protein